MIGMLYHKHLYFNMICNIAIMIYSSCVESRPSHAPSSSSNQDHEEIRIWLLEIYIALNELHKPILGDILSLEVFAHVVVPHESSIHYLVVPYLCLECILN